MKKVPKLILHNDEENVTRREIEGILDKIEHEEQ